MDFGTIEEALDSCPRTPTKSMFNEEDSRFYNGAGTVYSCPVWTVDGFVLRSDIWRDYLAVFIEGPGADVTINSCIIQSDSVVNQANLAMKRTGIVDCAATGLYVETTGGTLHYSRAHAVVVKSNIVCNEFGAKVLRKSALTSTIDLTEMLNIQTRFRDFHERLPDANKYSIAPSDHSGVYIEQPELRWKTLSSR
eukprot:g5524.t1 g5524   contig2:699180-700260(+)